MSNISVRDLTQVSTRTTIIGGGTLVGAALAASALAWPSLPEEMIVRWDAGGSPDGFASRALGAFMLPLVAAALLGLFELLPRTDPLESNFADFRGHYNGFVLLIIGFLTLIHGVVLATNLGYDVAVTPAITGFIGFVFLYVSLLLAVAEPNWFVGIRTPWTLSSESVWHRTHALGSLLFGVLGAVVLVISLVDLLVTDLGEAPIFVLAGGAGLIAIGTFAYSYYVYVKLGRPDDHPSGE